MKHPWLQPLVDLNPGDEALLWTTGKGNLKNAYNQCDREDWLFCLLRKKKLFRRKLMLRVTADVCQTVLPDFQKYTDTRLPDALREVETVLADANCSDEWENGYYWLDPLFVILFSFAAFAKRNVMVNTIRKYVTFEKLIKGIISTTSS
jgi:hypothetical protein